MPNFVLSSSSYSVTVNYNLAVKKLIKAGKFYCVKRGTTSHRFSSNEKGVVEVLVSLVNFNCCNIEYKDALKELDRHGLRPATLKELLTLIVAQPDLHNDPIVALGSTWRDFYGDTYVPYLYSYGSGRDLDLVTLGNVWFLSSPSFAAVPK